jgi:hypothetical protein
MTKQFCLGLLALLLNIVPASARPVPCDGGVCMPVTFRLTSLSETARYGLLVTSPTEIACGSVQFILSDAGGGVVGRTQALHPGEMQVVRIGRGYPAGDYALQITASGCPVAPAHVRHVRLGKPSPDHGWRAAMVMQARLAP